jgi:hypothetical protein
MGATTLVTNIINKYLDNGIKCLVFEATDGFYLTHIERLRIIKENLDIDSIRPWFVKDGNLVVVYNYFFEFEALWALINEYDANLIVYEASRHLLDQKYELIRLAEKLKSTGKTFIFVTHMRRKINKFSRLEKNTPSVSRHHKAIPYFDATAIVYRDAYYNEGHGGIEEIRIYERGKKKYRAVPVEFDFQHQRVKLK